MTKDNRHRGTLGIGSMTGRMTNEGANRAEAGRTDVVGTMLFDAAKVAVDNAVDYGTGGHKIITVEDFEALKAAVSLAEKKAKIAEKSS